MHGENRTKTHILVQLNDALGKRRVTARLELDFIERRRESKVVHQQGVLIPVVGHCFRRSLRVLLPCVWHGRRTETLSMGFPMGTKYHDALGLVFS